MLYTPLTSPPPALFGWSESSSDGSQDHRLGPNAKVGSNTVFNAQGRRRSFSDSRACGLGACTRIGYADLLPMTKRDGRNLISGGLLDVNDNGSNACGSVHLVTLPALISLSQLDYGI